MWQLGILFPVFHSLSVLEFYIFNLSYVSFQLSLLKKMVHFPATLMFGMSVWLVLENMWLEDRVPIPRKNSNTLAWCVLASYTILSCHEKNAFWVATLPKRLGIHAEETWPQPKVLGHVLAKSPLTWILVRRK